MCSNVRESAVFDHPLQSKLNYNGQETPFDGNDMWIYGNDFARNVVIFGIDDNLSSSTNNGSSRWNTNQRY